MRLVATLIPVLTLVLGAEAVLLRGWPLIYPIDAVLAAVVLYVTIRLFRSRLDAMSLAVVVVGAWLGEYLVLASGVIDNDLNPGNALFYWVLATAGPMQPAAAFIGGWLALRR